METLLTAGEFAKLARTTKRTVLWYAKIGVLNPYKTDDIGYRYYRPGQIIDFQSILLMCKLGFSLADIRVYLTEGRSLQGLFEQKRQAIEQHIGTLERMLADTDRYYHNLDATGTLVQPHIKEVSSFTMYYISKEGPYSSIKDYSAELQAAFLAMPANAVRLTAFVNGGYRPQKAKMKIGVLCRPDLQIKPGAVVHTETVPSYTALSYTHQGSTTLLSLLWQELAKYRRKHRLTADSRLPFANIEFYQTDTSLYRDPQDSLIAELHMPIRKRS